MRWSWSERKRAGSSAVMGPGKRSSRARKQQSYQYERLRGPVDWIQGEVVRSKSGLEEHGDVRFVTCRTEVNARFG